MFSALHRAYTKAATCDFENEKIIEQKIQNFPVSVALYIVSDALVLRNMFDKDHSAQICVIKFIFKCSRIRVQTSTYDSLHRRLGNIQKLQLFRVLTLSTKLPQTRYA
jgi:hypothetical protein